MGPMRACSRSNAIARFPQPLETCDNSLGILLFHVLGLLHVENPSLEFGNIFSIVKYAYGDDDKREKHKDRSDEKERNNDFGKDNNESHSVWGDIHEMSAQFMLFFVFFHVIGVAVSSKIHNENLIKSMITGTKGTHSS